MEEGFGGGDSLSLSLPLSFSLFYGGFGGGVLIGRRGRRGLASWVSPCFREKGKGEKGERE